MNQQSQFDQENDLTLNLKFKLRNISPLGTAFLDISEESDLSKNGTVIEKIFDGQFENIPILIVRETENKYHAFCSVCPHERKRVRTPIYPEIDLICYAHHCHFSQIDGHVIIGPSKDSLTKYKTFFNSQTKILTITSEDNG
ncbi:MAG: Rieske 2Fe-2S domain-containing protein [Candidatus Kapabacteria bacterium]|nr:Rieske 2Fe-2S domain-containing protein [Candidatus Kapabacteria bacterium]